MNDATIAAYDGARNFATKKIRSACYAPQTSMYFDTRGNVRVCCKNVKYVLGNVAESSLKEIWRGAKARGLRRSLGNYNFNAGCQFCEWEIEEGNYRNTYAHLFDRFAVDALDPEWPSMMEFTISNTCNLECIMCYGELSSAIRSRRDGLPPLPKVYGDRFFEELREFLPHLKEMKFLGGEPFLAQETLRIWDMMVEDGIHVPCHVTTNGTQYNKRVERIVEKIPFSLAISFDGITKPTVESIRKNADFDVVMENFKRFHAYAARKGTNVSLTYCLMRQNWQEFGDFLLFADEYNCDTFVNTVVDPAECSLSAMSTEDLDEIRESMIRQDATLRGRLRRNLHVWDEELARVKNFRGQPSLAYVKPKSGSSNGQAKTEPATNGTVVELQTAPSLDQLVEIKPTIAPELFGATFDPNAIRPEHRLYPMTEEQARSRLDRWAPAAEVFHFTLDPAGVIQSARGSAGEFLGLATGATVGLTPIEWRRRLGSSLIGIESTPLAEFSHPHFLDRSYALKSEAAGERRTRAISAPRLGVGGSVDGVDVWIALANGSPEVIGEIADPFTNRLGAASDPGIDESIVRRLLRDWPVARAWAEFHCNLENRVVDVVGDDVLGIGRERCLGRDANDLVATMMDRYGDKLSLIHQRHDVHHTDRLVRFERDDSPPTWVRIIALPRRDEKGHLTGTVSVVAASRERSA